MAAITAMLAIGAPVAAADTVGFTPPDRPMILTRTLHRPLPGGAEVVTRRSYQIRFLPSAEGYRIEGALLHADIEAPPRFAALAAIERNRPDTGLFPIVLDHRGRMLPVEPHEAGKSALVAGRLAQSQLPANLSEEETRKAQAFIGRISANRVQTAWPEDLFHPEPGERRVTRTIPMPDGKTGQATIEIDADADADNGLLTRLTRRVTTALDGSQRVTIETWSLHASQEKPASAR